MIQQEIGSANINTHKAQDNSRGRQGAQRHLKWHQTPCLVTFCWRIHGLITGTSSIPSSCYTPFLCPVSHT